MLLLPAGALAMSLHKFYKTADGLPAYEKMPVLFIGHGSPTNAIEDNNFTRSMRSYGEKLPPPKAVLVVSAHWLTRGETKVSVNPDPDTIHDYYGFPDEMYKLKYDAPGHPDMAREVVKNVQSVQVHEDHEMGLDHGAWTVLKYLFPKADIPVFQLSIDFNKPPQWHFNLAAELKKLREKGVMILGSGNIVHNLRVLDWKNPTASFDWATEFDDFVKNKIDTRDFQALIDYNKMGKVARLAVPTNDHYLPMLYSLGLADEKEEIRHTYEQMQHGSISMRCFEVGG